MTCHYPWKSTCNKTFPHFVLDINYHGTKDNLGMYHNLNHIPITNKNSYIIKYGSENKINRGKLDKLMTCH